MTICLFYDAKCTSIIGKNTQRMSSYLNHFSMYFYTSMKKKIAAKLDTKGTLLKLSKNLSNITIRSNFMDRYLIDIKCKFQKININKIC